jgi:hypothetical protein
MSSAIGVDVLRKGGDTAQLKTRSHDEKYRVINIDLQGGKSI